MSTPLFYFTTIRSKSMPFFRTNPPPLADGPALQSTQQPQPVCTWSAHAPQSGWSKSPFPRGHHTLTTTTTATVAGEFLLFGGTIGLQASSELYLFSTRDFSMDLLKTSGEVPSPRARHSAVLIGSTLLVHGGMGSSDENLPSHSSLYLLSLGTSDILMPSPTPADHRFVLQYHESGPTLWLMVPDRVVVTTIPQPRSVPSSLSLVVGSTENFSMICGHSI